MNNINKKHIIRFMIVGALLTQISHAQEVYFLISNKSDLQYYVSWLFAFSLEGSILLFTLYGKKNQALFFSVVSCLINLISYWFSVGWTQQFLAMVLISPIIPITIFHYSELIKDEQKQNEQNEMKEKRKRRKRNPETGELEDISEIGEIIDVNNNYNFDDNE